MCMSCLRVFWKLSPMHWRVIHFKSRMLIQLWISGTHHIPQWTKTWSQSTTVFLRKKKFSPEQAKACEQSMYLFTARSQSPSLLFARCFLRLEIPSQFAMTSGKRKLDDEMTTCHLSNKQAVVTSWFFLSHIGFVSIEILTYWIEICLSYCSPALNNCFEGWVPAPFSEKKLLQLYVCKFKNSVEMRTLVGVSVQGMVGFAHNFRVEHGGWGW